MRKKAAMAVIRAGETDSASLSIKGCGNKVEVAKQSEIK